MRKNDVKTGNDGLIEPECCLKPASAQLVASVNGFNAFACTFIQCCSTLVLVSGCLLQSAALRQAYKTTLAPWPMGPSSEADAAPNAFCNPSHALLVSQSQFPSSVLAFVGLSGWVGATLRRAPAAPAPAAPSACTVSSSFRRFKRTFAIQRIAQDAEHQHPEQLQTSLPLE
jgi:hypothetical protein